MRVMNGLKRSSGKLGFLARLEYLTCVPRCDTPSLGLERKLTMRERLGSVRLFQLCAYTSGNMQWLHHIGIGDGETFARLGYTSEAGWWPDIGRYLKAVAEFEVGVDAKAQFALQISPNVQEC